MFVPKRRALAQAAVGANIGAYAIAFYYPQPASWLTSTANRRMIKRFQDLVIASVALIVCGPVMLLAALSICLMLKFRSMRHGAACPSRLQQVTKDDERVTWIGHILRRTSIGELPQFFNVLRGDMSVVGPRPHAPGTCAGGVPFEHMTPR